MQKRHCQNAPQRQIPNGLHKANINNLATEVLVMIFRYLSFKDQRKLTTVCTRWNDILSTSPVLRGINLYLDMLPNLSIILHKSLVYLDIQEMTTGRLDVLEALCNLFPNLRALDLIFCRHTGMLPDVNQLQEYPEGAIRVLKDSFVGPWHFNLIPIYFKRLVRLNLTGNVHLFDGNLRAISTELLSLKSLKLDYCEEITDVGIEFLCGQRRDGYAGPPKLEYLSLVKCKALTERTVQYVKEGQPSLLTLNLSKWKGLTQVGFKHLANMKKLQNLMLNRCNFDPAGMIHLADGGSKIVMLQVIGFEDISDDILEHLGRLTNLKSLNLSCCLISDLGLELLVKHGSKLDTLDLSYCDEITDASMVHVAKLANLRILKIGKTDVGDAGIDHLVQGGSRISSIKCTHNLTDVGFRHLAKLANLSQVHVKDCEGVTGEGLEDLLTGLGPKLERLGLVGCGRLSYRTLSHVAWWSPSIEWLKLDPNHWDDNGLVWSAANLPRMHSLWIDGVNDIGMVHELCVGFQN